MWGCFMPNEMLANEKEKHLEKAILVAKKGKTFKVKLGITPHMKRLYNYDPPSYFPLSYLLYME